MTTTTKLANRFISFDHHNPRVWDLFVRFTHEAIRANHSTFSAQSIIERIRWKTSVETRGGLWGEVRDAVVLATLRQSDTEAGDAESRPKGLSRTRPGL